MTRFRDGFMMKSPLHAHRDLEKKLNILKNNPEKAAKMGLSSDRGDGKDYEAISKLKEKIKEEEAKHSSERTESDDAQIRQDEDAARGSAAEMSPMKKKSAPLNASYANPQDYFYVSNRGDFQKLFDNISSNTAKVIDARNDPEKESDRLQRRIDNRNARQVKKGKGSYDASGDYQANDAASEFEKKTGEIAIRQKQNATRASNQAKDPCKNKTKGTQTYDSYGNPVTC